MSQHGARPSRDSTPIDSIVDTNPAIATIQSTIDAATGGTISQRPHEMDRNNPPSSTRGLVVGDVIGHYRIFEQLGSGAMGYIHRARDERLERDVAIKLALESISTDADAILREARSLAALNHPNVVHVYEVGVHQHRPYIVMELLRGETLRTRMDRAAPSLVEALGWACDVLRGLSAAHQAHIMHLDVKPDNVFLTKDGPAKLLDFGVARQKRSGIYQADVIVGTVAYMAPEQLLGDTLDFRADIFAFGTVLYELVTGKHPFMRPKPAATMFALTNGDFFHEGHMTDPDVEAIVRKCMQLEPANRPPSAARVLEELERVLRARTRSGSQPSQAAYVETDHGNVAFQCAGPAGKPRLLVVPGLLSRFDAWTHEPEGASFLRQLTQVGPIILFDHAGLGASERVSEAACPAIDDEVDHIDAVLDAAGATRVVLFALDTGAPLAALYAAVRPERVAGLVIYGGAPTYTDPEARTRLSERTDRWGTDQNAILCAPSHAGDTRILKWIAFWERVTAGRKMARTWINRLTNTDATALLPFITCPTLVLHREGDRFCVPAQSMPFVESIAGVERALLPGADHFVGIGAHDVAAQIVRFVRAHDPAQPDSTSEKGLGTWLLTDSPPHLLPARLRPRFALERDSLLLLRVDRPGAVERTLAHHESTKINGVVTCASSSANPEEIFDELKALLVEKNLAGVTYSPLARAIIDGTLGSLVEEDPDSDWGTVSRDAPPLPKPLSLDAISPASSRVPDAALPSSENTPAPKEIEKNRKIAPLLLIIAIVSALGIAYFVLGMK